MALGGAYIHTLAKHPLKVYQSQSFQVIRSFLLLARKILASGPLQSKLKTQLTRINEQKAYFGSITAPRVIDNFASLYLETAEALQLRLQMAGKKEFLQDPQIIAQIRAVLFSGVRAAVMWYQLHGSVLNFFFERQLILQEVKPLLGSV